jgi:hypothetical protein
LVLTERCNMRCEHCCVSATSRGRDMSLSTFKHALQSAAEYGEELLFFGGGEPLLHKLFWTFLEKALAGDFQVAIVTNGKVHDRALAVAALAKQGVISAELSQDMYHERVSADVVRAFQRDPLPFIRDTFDKLAAHIRQETQACIDRRGIRDVTQGGRKSPIRQGRWKSGDNTICTCSGDPYVNVDGKVYQCGCPGSPCVGSVRKGFSPLCDGDDGPTWECYRDLKKPEKVSLEVCPA